MKIYTMYEVREFVASRYSTGLGFKLRSRSDAARIVNRIKKSGRNVFYVPVKIAR